MHTPPPSEISGMDTPPAGLPSTAMPSIGETIYDGVMNFAQGVSGYNYKFFNKSGAVISVMLFPSGKIFKKKTTEVGAGVEGGGSPVTATAKDSMEYEFEAEPIEFILDPKTHSKEPKVVTMDCNKVKYIAAFTEELGKEEFKTFQFFKFDEAINGGNHKIFSEDHRKFCVRAKQTSRSFARAVLRAKNEDLKITKEG